MKYEIEGKLIEVFPIEQITGTFKKKDFVIEVLENGRTMPLKFQLTNNFTNQLDQIAVGSQVFVIFSIRGNKWQEKYFVNLQALHIAEIQNDIPQTSNPDPVVFSTPITDDDDFPF